MNKIRFTGNLEQGCSIFEQADYQRFMPKSGPKKRLCFRSLFSPFYLGHFGPFWQTLKNKKACNQVIYRL